MTIAVIGGGFSGLMTAAQLGARGIATTVIEPNELGRGIAYADTGSELLLNVPAASMSALPDDREHFARWLADRGLAPTFAPRALYGEYVGETAAALAGGRIEIARTRASSIARSATGFRVTCEDGSAIPARAVVLALGNAAPRMPAVIERSPHLLSCPYRAPLAITDRDASVVLLGTGLTALDVIAGLRTRGHRGPILAVSRRGLTPVTFDPAIALPPVEVPRTILRSPRLATLLAWWKSRRLYSIPEVAVVCALRPHLSTLWRRLPVADRARFVRHLRPRWDVLRHRAPPPIAAIAATARQAGALEIATGSLVATSRVGDSLRCTFLTPKKTMLVRDASYLVNCTGPERDVAAQRAPLVQSLLASGLIERDSLGLGVCTDDQGRLIGRDGFVPRAYTVGPWRIADAWESTAVPELRDQAANTASTIAGDLSAWVEAHRVSTSR